MPGRLALPRQHRGFGPPRRLRALPQDAGEEAVEAFVVARRHRIARGADMGVMNAQVFGPEMRIQHRSKEEVGQPSFQA